MYFYVDESGDPYFYDRRSKYIVGEEGSSKILLLGFIKTEDPSSLRRRIAELRSHLAQDEYLQSIPSFKKSLIAFHAKDDCPEVREKMFKAIVEMKFKAEFVFARKQESIFIQRHKKSPNVFYD